MKEYWIVIERQYNDKSLAVGPYASLKDAYWAMDHAILIDGLCMKDCLEALITENKPKLKTHDIVIIDTDDPDHTGVGEQSNVDAELVILPYNLS